MSTPPPGYGQPPPPSAFAPPPGPGAYPTAPPPRRSETGSSYGGSGTLHGPTGAPPTAGTPKKRHGWLLPTVVGALALFVGVSVGASGGTDSSTELAALEEENAQLSRENNELLSANEALQAENESVQTAADAVDPGPVVEPTDPATATGPTTAPADAPDFTRTSPGAIGTTTTIGDRGESWDVTLGAPTFNADDSVAAENMFNDPAPDGLAYVIVPVTATYHGAETSNLWLDIDVTFVTASGNSYDESTSFVVGPGDLSDLGELYDGASGTGNVTMAIPVGAQDEAGATWSVQAGWFNEPVFFAAR
ncbi:hypothetical protein EXU48_14945 [Occultella glacieicola]|uniref:DUF4352 domain-containing protein n=1 Tax=Occultella glacieicola TaxID=2518684 RepID=A0ABY2E2V3_9MICO|nr:cell division protein ZapB [Occultella glacieicola]TDE92801.1 hypothetical protein EXU48_14945 [Occultella glacieicola]